MKRPEEMIGQILGHYRILRPIGYGGMATVFLAQDINLRREVAVKVFWPRSGDTAAFLQRFAREAYVLAQLDHPNILPIYEYGEQNGLAYLVVPYMAGGSLRDLLQARRMLPPTETLRLATQILNALQYAHDRGLIHRDIKPDNMLLKPDSTLMLSDFGLVKVMSVEGDNTPPIATATQTGQIFGGTPEYIAPEQATGQPLPVSDIYSLGVVLYEMLTGTRPFTADNALGVIVKHLYERPPSLRQFNPQISPQLDATVLRAIEKDPTKRYQRPADFLSALVQAITSEMPGQGSQSQHIVPPFPSPTSSPPIQQSSFGPSISPLTVGGNDPQANINTFYKNPQSGEGSYGRGASDPEAERATFVKNRYNGLQRSNTPSPPVQPNPAIGASKAPPPGQYVPSVPISPSPKRSRTSPIVVAVLIVVIVGLITSLYVFSRGHAPSTGGGGNNPPSTSVPVAPASQQVFRWGSMLTDIYTFDPGIATDQNSINAISMVFTGLVQLDDNLRVQPQMASSYKVSSDGMTYTFILKPNLKFSDGTPLTSADVAYSIDRSLSPAINNQSGLALTYLDLIQGAVDRVAGKVSTIIGTGVMTPDANTVVVKITKPAAYFLQAFTYPTSYVVEKSVINQWGNKWTDHLSDNAGQGGDGPWKVKSYSHTTGIVFVPNPNYYGKQPQMHEVDFQFYNGSTPSYAAYQANQTDFSSVPFAEYNSVKSSKEFSATPTLTIFYIGMNYLVKPLDNIHIRQALALALNRDLIVQAVFNGAYMPTCHIVPQGMYGYDSSLTCPDGTGTTGDQTKAKALFQQGLQEEGLTVATFPKLTYTYPSGSTDTANAVTTELQMWKNVLGITVGTATVDQNTLFNQEVATTCSTPSIQSPDLTKCVGKGLQIWSTGWAADYPDPQDWITLQFGDGQPYNEFNFANNLGSDAPNQKSLQKQMDAADVIQNSTQRAQAYNSIEQTLVNDVAWLSLYQRPDLHMVKSYVVGLTFNAFSVRPPDDWPNVYIAVH